MFIPFYPDKTTMCSVCKKTKEACQWHALLKKYLCTECRQRKNYSTTNVSTRGKKQKRLPTFSLEFEVEEPTASTQTDPRQVEAALRLLLLGFIRAYDGTVSDEYKSPLYCSLRSFYPSLDAMHDLRHLVGKSCGTHIHVEFHFKEHLNQNIGEIWGPLLWYIYSHPQETLVFWGRPFNTYAQLIPSDRYFIFNTQSKHPTLEFRLPCFREKTQFLAIVKFCRELVALLNKHLPQAQANPLLLPQIGGEILKLYLSYLPGPSDHTWFHTLPQEQQEQFMHTAKQVSWSTQFHPEEERE